MLQATATIPVAVQNGLKAPPTSGEKKNCINAKTKVANPPQRAAMPTSSLWVSSMIRSGKTGMIRANASASIATVPVMKIVAAVRGRVGETEDGSGLDMNFLCAFACGLRKQSFLSPGCHTQKA